MFSPDVKARYSKDEGEKEWFNYVHLDKAKSTLDMLQAIARSLHVQFPDGPAPHSDVQCTTPADKQALQNAIITTLSSKRTILVLDELDTPWREERSETETILARLYEGAAASNSPMVAVITGDRRPLKVPWGLRIDLTPLSDCDSMRYFISVANKIADAEAKNGQKPSALLESETLRLLITSLDGIPLALKVMASMAAITACKNGGTHDDWMSVLSTMREEWQTQLQCTLTCERNGRSPAKQKEVATQPLFTLWVSLWVALQHLDIASRDVFARISSVPDGEKINNDPAVEELEKRALIVVQEDDRRVRRVRLAPSVRDFVCKGPDYCDFLCSSREERRVRMMDLLH